MFSFLIILNDKTKSRRSGIQIRTIKLAVTLVRGELSNPNQPRANLPKYRRYLRGEIDSYILVRIDWAPRGGYDQSVTWVSEKDLVEKYLKWDRAMTVINVKLVMSPHVE